MESKIFYMNLAPSPYKLIVDKKKTIEMRLDDPRRKGIKAGDFIVFTNNETNKVIKCEVLDVKHFDSFDSLYKSYDKKLLGYDENDNADPKDMEIYYKKEDILFYGVLAIKIRFLGEIVWQ